MKHRDKHFFQQNDNVATHNNYSQLTQHLNRAFFACSIEKDETGNPVDYILRECNPACKNIWMRDGEFDAGIILNKSLREILFEPEYWLKKYNEAYSTGQTVEFVRHMADYGRSIQAMVFPSSDNSQILAFVEDISKQEAIKQTLNATQNKYRYLFENLNLAFLVASIETESNGKISYVIRDMNPACGELWKNMNVDYTNLINKNLKDALTLSDFWVEKCNEARTTNKTLQFSTYTPIFNKTLKATIFMSKDQTQLMAFVEDITEQEYVKQTLKSAQSKYQHLFENLNLAFVAVFVEKDENGNVLDYIVQNMNPACAKVWEGSGNDPKKLIGKSLRDALIKPDFWVQVCNQVYQTGETVQFKKYVDVFNKTLKGSIFLSTDGTILGLLEDISIQENTEKALLLSENKFSEVFKNFDVAMITNNVTIGNDGSITYIVQDMNAACAPLWKVSEDVIQSFIGKDFNTIVPEPDFWVEQTNIAYHSGNSVHLVRYNKTTGRYIKAIIFALADKSQMLALLEDVTERETAIQNVQELNASLQKIQDYARIGTLTIYANGEHTWNNVMYQLFEYNTNVKPSMEVYLARVHSEEKEFIHNAYSTAIKNKDRFFSCELRLEFEDGRIKYLYTEIENFYKNGEWTHTNGWLQDITPRRRTELQLIYAKEKAEEADRLKSAFLANMSHEIRTPLNAIVGFSNLLARKNYSDEKRQLFLSDIQNNSKQLLSIINDILDISKIESDQLDLSYIWIDLNQLMQEIYDSMQLQIKDKNISLFCQKTLPDSQVQIYMDDVRLKQILINLISNAIKFTEQGFINFGYSLKNGNTLEFFVKDTGIGIALENQKEIFEYFRQEDGTTTRKFGGTGLGLSISKRLVELMGGKIWVESEKDKGANFFFDVPYILHNNTPLEDNTLSANEDTSDNAFPVLNGEKVLVIDDHDSSFVLISEFFAEHNVTVEYANSGQAGIDYVEKNPSISLIFMDIHMPFLNGVETMKAIKEKHPEIPIVAQTAFALKEDKEKYLASGFNDYLSKPLHAQELTRITRRFLGKDE